ncbi:M56 family metallopeptidase [Dyadobacter sp. 32]|uniref:M56 family metallopeptidase n=1 Tax=Dyadobacter sp. 32 TaxID=538966 RepID=UPI0011EEE00B
MSPFIDYLIKLTIGLSATSLFYLIVLRRHTFYNWNRWYLLIYSALSFVIPFVNISPALENGQFIESKLVETIPTVQDLTLVKMGSSEEGAPPFVVQEPDSSAGLELWQQVLIGLFILGVLVMVIRLAINWVCYLSIKRKAALITDEDVQIYYTSREIVPFSFGRGIFVNPALHEENELQEIFLHELVHVKQRHSVDIIWAEILCVLNWYNPFAWMIRHAIRQNHEYIADRAVLEHGVNAREYQYLLLKVVGVPEVWLANQFNFSSLKRRIIMMNKNKTAPIFLLTFLFGLPLLVLSVIIFRNKADTTSQGEITRFYAGMQPAKMTRPGHLAGIVLDGQTGLPVVGLPLKVSINDTFYKTILTDRNGFYFERINSNDSIGGVGIDYETQEYKGFGTSGSAIYGTSQVVFVAKNEASELQTEVFWENFEFPNGKVADVTQAAFTFLQSKAKERGFLYNLVMTFRNKYHWANKEVTKYQNAYFDRERRLIGYVNELKFFLDGKEVTYQKINDAFEYSRVVNLNVKRAPGSGSSFFNPKLASKMYFYTFPTSKVAPPAASVSKDNVVTVDIEKFDLSVLENDAYMLEGFRQVNGIGSNLRPAKEDIKRIFLFKGNLARYYDGKLKKLWWIETRPVEEVNERPDLAVK